jgi:transcription elongation factor Elf1
MQPKPSIDIAEIDAKLGPARHMHKRTRELSLRLLQEFQCPSCRIEHERRSLLVPIAKASSGILRCYFCGEDFPAPERT